jgi:hypothetical protein
MTEHVPASPALPGQRVYIPGYAGWKLLLCVCGVVVFILGLMLLWPPLHLVISGCHSQAVALCVVRTKAGLPDLVLTSDSAIGAHLAKDDASYTFWNEFSFTTVDGRQLAVRDNVGSRLQPLYPLLDADGLRTTATVCYNPGQPQSAIFPGEISTWLIAAVLTLAGLACTIISGTLLYWSDKPIELPDIPPDHSTPKCPF